MRENSGTRYRGRTNSNGSGCPEPSKSRSAGTLSPSVLMTPKGSVKLLEEIISAFSPQTKRVLHERENGPGGIRTRICDCDRVPCSHYFAA